MIRLYKLSGNALTPVTPGRLAKEDMIEGWIAKQPELLGLDRLLIIGRQVTTTYGGSIDLLGIDDEGNVVILELKRDRTPRDVIGQVLDYASWVAKLSTREVHDIASSYLKKSLDIAFYDRFNTNLPDSLNENHTILIIASAFDASSERIVRYLSETHDIAINTAFFTVFEDNGQTLLATDWLLDQTEVGERSDAKIKVTASELIMQATEKKVSYLVEICRKLSGNAKELVSSTYGGSFRYIFKGKVILGVNVAGVRRRSPDGELDVWIPAPALSEVVVVPEQDIRAVLKHDFNATEGGAADCLVRLNSSEMAESLVTLVTGWLGKTAKSGDDLSDSLATKLDAQGAP